MQSPNITSRIINLPIRFNECGFKNFIEKNESHKEAKVACKKFFSYETDKTGLFFCGTIGTGKTHLAIATLKNLKPIPVKEGLVRPATAHILNADEFFMMCNDAISEKKSKLELIKGVLTQNDVLLLDDLGTKNFTESKQENLYALINYAYLNLRKIIITTNFMLDDLATFDERIASRIYEMCHIAIIEGEDYRITN